MSHSKEGPSLTSQDVTNWIANKADEQTTRLIEEDLKRPDGEVREYLEWMADPSKHPTPRLAERHIQSAIEAAGGPREFAERFRKAMEGLDEIPEERGRGR